jgi:hypothetical protein
MKPESYAGTLEGASGGARASERETDVSRRVDGFASEKKSLLDASDRCNQLTDYLRSGGSTGWSRGPVEIRIADVEPRCPFKRDYREVSHATIGEL